MTKEYIKNCMPPEMRDADDKEAAQWEDNKRYISCALKLFRRRIHDNGFEKGFWPEFKKINGLTSLIEARKNVNIGERIAWIHSELGEAFEAVRQGFPADPDCPEHDNFTIELGDALILILDLAEALNLDLEEAMFAKIEHNKSRPYKHGKEF